MKNYFSAIATLMGTIIGVGMFAMPYAIAKAGLLPLFFYMPVLALIQYLLHLYYAEIVLSTNGDHRLTGYAVKIFGTRRARIFTLIITLISDFGVLLAYIIFGGIFLHQLLNPIFGGSLLSYAAILFLIQAVIILFGIKMIAGAEFFMTGFMIVVIGLIIWYGRGLIHLANFTDLDWHYFFYPYGPIFFSVGGMAAIPEVCKLLRSQPEKIKPAIAWATFTSAGIMMIFVLAIVGMTGIRTSPDALAGLARLFGPGIIGLTLTFGLLAIVTSFLTIGQACRETFWWDLGMNKYTGWAIACFVPFCLYLIGWRNLTTTVSLTGAFSGGMLGILTLMLVLKVKKKCDLKSAVISVINNRLAYILSGLFIFGLAYEIWAALN